MAYWRKTLNVEYFVSADMKFIQLLLGLCGATGEYACPWCKVNKEGRSDLTRPWDYYHNPSIGRNIEDMLDSNFKKAMVSCGVSFHMWHNKAGEIEWTSLSRTEKVKLLNHLPSKLASEDGVIFENSKHSVIKLWEDFYVLYKYVNDTTDSGEVIFEKAKLWLENFLNIGKLCRKGYNLHNVTPYMHCLVYHVPFFASHFGPLKMFSGQGLEKNNDIVKQIHQKKSNKWDSAVSALVTRKRLEFGHTNNLEREKRAYEKFQLVD
ncbi:unnamed protein product [Mytilus edulis]|uniref:Uncharacterized protein n=1 Tax=Mytilus edulis TaxID=6550 RepID=A0A8S3ULF0_MYTED|nr:unnamed protein product [Mytilus edulis]